MDLYDYQREDVDWLAETLVPDVKLLWHEMGVGKTVEAAALAGRLVAREREGWGISVFCPASVRPTWLRELRRWAPAARSRVARLAVRPTKPRKDGTRVREGSPAEPFTWPDEGEAVVWGFSALQRLRRAPPRRCPRPVLLVIDEGHFVRGASAQAEAVETLRRATLAADGSVLHMTGTPVETDPDDLRRTLERLGIFRRTFGSARRFEDHFGLRVLGDGRRVWRSDPPSVLPILGRYCRRRSAADVQPWLPEIVYSTRVAGAPRSTVRALARLAKALDPSARAGTSARSPAVDLPVDGGDLAEQRAAIARAKIPWLLRTLDELEVSLPGEALAAYSFHVDQEGEDGFARAFADRPGWELVIGATPPGARERKLEAYRRGEKHLACSSAVATGVTLHGAEHGRQNRYLVRCDLSWSPLLIERQLVKRWHRPGLRAPLHVVDLVLDHPVERAVYRVHRRKTNLAQSILD